MHFLPSFFLHLFLFLSSIYWLAICRGEELFALPLTDYPELMQTQKEVKLADQLFSLYVDVLGTLSDWKNVLWSDVTKQIGEKHNLFLTILFFRPTFSSFVLLCFVVMSLRRCCLLIRSILHWFNGSCIQSPTLTLIAVSWLSSFFDIACLSIMLIYLSLPPYSV